MNPPADALLALLRARAQQEPTRVFSDAEWKSILSLASRHGVGPLAHRALQDSGWPAPEFVRSGLEEERRATALLNLQKYGELRRIAEALASHGIPVIPLKGLPLAELVYQDISLRPMVDLDLLVPTALVEDALRVLAGLEYGFAADLAPSVRGLLASKCNIGLRHRRLDVWLELHWSIAEPASRYAGAVAQIWNGAKPARIGDADVLAMSAEWLLLHVCSHLAYGHGFAFGLRALCDVSEMAKSDPAPDYSRVLESARNMGWQTGVAATLALARCHLNAPIPANVASTDELDADLLSEALEHLLTCVDLPDELQTAPALMGAAGTRRRFDMVSAAWKRVFAPRAELALLYGVPEDSPRIPLLYALRARDLIRRYASSAWGLAIARPALRTAASRHVRLARWLREG